MQLRIKNIRQHIILKNLAGVFILCTFLLSITPKQVVHSLAANHRDQPSKKNVDKSKIQFTGFGYNCDCDSIVATSPFTENTLLLEITPLVHLAVYKETTTVSLSSNDHFYFTLRGPPAVA
ncbi:hypothetical protein BH11BAC4_BH11BAC4_00670 [soil metagenome]